MSKPLTVTSVQIKPQRNAVQLGEVIVTLSNQERLEPILFSSFDSQEMIIKKVANAVVEANQISYWHPITKGHILALIKLKRAVIAKGVNSVHTSRDMNGTENELTKLQYTNFTFLRYHALVAKDKNAGAGYWLLTRRGNQFLKGEVAIPHKVKTENNEVIDHSEVHVYVNEVWDGTPYFEPSEIERQWMEPVQAAFALEAGDA